ncbi:uncharacterized protein LOC142574370 [Dermacentor variabilis]|uniref:uncharacterized protein LOC142574370 n=1 Tax=Dermacentor variabilis TaxID=34621 RepID=UPI003F5BAE9E
MCGFFISCCSTKGLRHLTTVSATVGAGNLCSCRRRSSKTGARPATMAAGTVIRYNIDSDGGISSSSNSASLVVNERNAGGAEAEHESVHSRERYVVMAMMLLLLIIGCTLFGMLFWMLSEDRATTRSCCLYLFPRSWVAAAVAEQFRNIMTKRST